MYKLKAKFEKNNSRGHFLHDETYISNGHFLIKQDMVKDCDKWKKVIGVADSSVFERIIDAVNCSGLKTYLQTPYMFDSGMGYARVFTSMDGENVAVQEEYVVAFDIDRLEGLSEYDALKSTDGVIVMPMRLPEKFANWNKQEKVA